MRQYLVILLYITVPEIHLHQLTGKYPLTINGGSCYALRKVLICNCDKLCIVTGHLNVVV
jgi:hypothetical protein